MGCPHLLTPHPLKNQAVAGYHLEAVLMIFLFIDDYFKISLVIKDCSFFNKLRMIFWFISKESLLINDNSIGDC